MVEKVYFREPFITALEKIKDSPQGKGFLAIIEIIEKKSPSGYFIYRWGGELDLIDGQAFELISSIERFRNFLERRRDQLLKQPSFIKTLISHFAWGGFWGFFGGSVAVGILACLAGLMLLIPSLTVFAGALLSMPIAPIVGSVILVGGVLLGLVFSIWPAFKSYQQERMLIESYSTEIKSILYGASEELRKELGSVMSWQESFFVKKTQKQLEIRTNKDTLTLREAGALGSLMWQLGKDIDRVGIDKSKYTITETEDYKTATIEISKNTQDATKVLNKISYLLGNASGTGIKEEDKKQLEEADECEVVCKLQ